MWDIVIIGGGASGLVSAVAACEQAARSGHSVPRITILETTDKIGRPILRSGNGRCNFSNAHITPDAYNDPQGVERVFAQVARAAADAELSQDTPNAVVAFFERLGLIWREESEGRLYPLANKASVVLDVLRAILLRFKIEIRCNTKVAKVVPPKAVGGHFTLHLQDGELVRARAVIIAAGGKGGAFGLESKLPYTATRPVLGPLATDACHTKPLDNIRVRGAVTLLRSGKAIAYERGEIQFRKYGVSGIAVFNLSRYAQKGDVLELDCAPDLPKGIMEERRALLGETLAKAPSNFELLQGVVLPLVADQILKAAGLEGALEASEGSARRIEEQLHALRLTVKGMGDEGLCQVSRGGFALSAFSPATLQANGIPGLFVTGEALDVDGACGGFNLHWAFATGMLAGWHAERAQGR